MKIGFVRKWHDLTGRDGNVCVCVACLWPLHFIFFSCHLLRIGSPDLLKLAAEHRTHLFICFFTRSFVAGVKNPSGILSPCVCLYQYQYCVSHAVCPFDTKLFANTHLYTIPNLFWALTDNKSRESNALQTKYINKFCLCSVFFLLFRNHTLFFVFFSFFSLTFIGNALLTTTKYI